ncbi:MAG: sulfoxide reductase heme-binding subunit YedZ [Acidobacteriota bacterium]|nr:sulfoxide reductase heme-binding subunit YedZ [Acidobacteriota bacterium]
MTRNQILKPLVWLVCLYWLLRLVQQGLTGHLGANPVERITHRTGQAALVLLLVGLAITPLRRWTRMLWLVQYRRLIGLFAFFYASLHLLTYLVLDQSFDLFRMAHDVAKRPFILIGTLAWLILLPLALTSTQAAIRRLGKRWTTLHRFVYLAAAFGCWHFFWSVKKDKDEPLQYVAVLVVLLASRLVLKYWPPQTRTQAAD